MYQREKNHASIIMWSIGNESYGGRVLYEESEFLRKIDPTRVIQYESLEYEEMYSNTREYPDTSDVESQMYIPAAKIEKGETLCRIYFDCVLPERGENKVSVVYSITFRSEGFEFSALPCTPFELENALHQDELPPYYQTTLCIYSRQMG